MRGLPLAAALVVLALVGCGSRAARAVELERGASLLVHPADVPRPLEQIDQREQRSYELRGTADRHGRRGGWIARYKRSGTVTTPGVLVLESRVDVFADRKGAGQELKDEVDGLRRTGARPLAAAKVGDDSHTFTVVQQGAHPVRFYSVVWRERNATASVTVQGWDGRIHLGDLLRLARSQDAHIRSA